MTKILPLLSMFLAGFPVLRYIVNFGFDSNIAHASVSIATLQIINGFTLATFVHYCSHVSSKISKYFFFLSLVVFLGVCVFISIFLEKTGVILYFSGIFTAFMFLNVLGLSTYYLNLSTKQSHIIDFSRFIGMLGLLLISILHEIEIGIYLLLAITVYNASALTALVSMKMSDLSASFGSKTTLRVNEAINAMFFIFLSSVVLKSFYLFDRFLALDYSHTLTNALFVTSLLHAAITKLVMFWLFLPRRRKLLNQSNIQSEMLLRNLFYLTIALIIGFQLLLSVDFVERLVLEIGLLPSHLSLLLVTCFSATIGSYCITSLFSTGHQKQVFVVMLLPLVTCLVAKTLINLSDLEFIIITVVFYLTNTVISLALYRRKRST